MSRIYFHSPSGEAVLRGSERAWLANLATSIAEGLLKIEGGEDAERLLKLVPPDHHLRKSADGSPGWFAPWKRTFHLSWSGMFSERTFTWRGQPLNPFSINLNTALKIGNDPIKLAARLHAQCEIHAWVDGPNRAWLADIIDEGLEAGLYRCTLRRDADSFGCASETDQGWNDVTALLRLCDDEPVITSHSSGDQFPCSTTADYRAWEALSADERWAAAMAELRADTESGLELTPADWKTFNFRHGLTAFDLNAADMEQRLDQALGLTATIPA